MTNKEKFKEVFEKTFGFVPEDCFPCPEKCPEEFVNSSCSDSCPYSHYWKKEYKSRKKKKDLLDEFAEIMDDLSSALKKHSPIKASNLFSLICLFMDTVTDDPLPVDDDLCGVRLDMAEAIWKSWPHAVEYYRKEK